MAKPVIVKIGQQYAIRKKKIFQPPLYLDLESRSFWFQWRSREDSFFKKCVGDFETVKDIFNFRFGEEELIANLK